MGTPSLAQMLAGELEREGASTAKLLARVPADRLDWTPHPKSSTLGDLAWHIAILPRHVAELVRAGRMDIATVGSRPRGGDDFNGELRKSLEDATALLAGLDDAALLAPFVIVRGEAPVANIPKLGAIRTIMFNHSYHHRGQLSVYLRMLDVPLPVMYGNSADER